MVMKRKEDRKGTDTEEGERWNSEDDQGGTDEDVGESNEYKGSHSSTRVNHGTELRNSSHTCQIVRPNPAQL